MRCRILPVTKWSCPAKLESEIVSLHSHTVCNIPNASPQAIERLKQFRIRLDRRSVDTKLFHERIRVFGCRSGNRCVHRLLRGKAQSIKYPDMIYFSDIFWGLKPYGFFRSFAETIVRSGVEQSGVGVMKKLLLKGAALAALTAAPAAAADMRLAAPPVYKGPFSWTGCFAGFNAGYIGSLERYDNTPSGAYSTIFTPGQIAQGQTSHEPDVGSYIAGAQFSCNYQWSSVVWGAEADFNGTGLNQTVLAAVPINSTWADRVETQTTKLPWFSTVRGRVGVAPLDGWLFYATGGLAVANVRSDFSFVASDGNAHVGSASTTRTGWTAGGGVEWTVAANWSVKFEYLYLDFGTWSYLSPNTSFFGGPATPAFTWTNTIHTREQIARIGINYRFGPSFANY